MPRGHRRHGRRRRHHHEPNPHQSDHAPHRQASQHRVRHATEHVRSSQQPRHGGRTALRRLVVPRFPREAPHFHEPLVPALHGLPRRPAGSRPSDFGGDGRRCPPLAPHVKAVHLRARGAGTRRVEAAAVSANSTRAQTAPTRGRTVTARRRARARSTRGSRTPARRRLPLFVQLGSARPVGSRRYDCPLRRQAAGAVVRRGVVLPAPDAGERGPGCRAGAACAAGRLRH